jgi:hypothetical protein
MATIRQLTAIQRAIALAALGAAFALGFIVGESANGSWVPLPPNVPTGDFVVGVIASVMGAGLLVAAGVAVGKLRGNPHH